MSFAPTMTSWQPRGVPLPCSILAEDYLDPFMVAIANADRLFHVQLP